MRRSRLSIVLAGGAVGIALLAGCSSDARKPARRSTSTTTHHASTTTATAARLTWRPGATVVVRAGAGGALSPGQQHQAFDIVRSYVTMATVRAVESGRADARLASLFTTAAQGRATTTDRATLTDERLATPTSGPQVSATATLHALLDANGALVMISADVDITAALPIAAGNITAHRTGSLLLVPAGSTLRIDGYALDVTRSVPGAPPTSTSAAVPSATSTTGGAP